MIYALSLLFPPSTSGALRLPLSASIIASNIVTFSDFLVISTTTDNTLSEIMGSTTLLKNLIATFPLVLRLVRRNRFPTHWYYQHGFSVRFLFHREEPDATPAVGSPGALYHTTVSHRLNISTH